MINSTIPLLYDALFGLSSIIQMSISSWACSENGITYDVSYYSINGSVSELITTKPVFRSWDQIISLNQYLEANYSYAGLNKKELEYLKVKHALLLETQTNPIFGSTSQQWVLTETSEI